MNKEIKNPALLPSGFADLLPPDAEQEADAIALLMGVFRQFGYQRIKPPLVEFEESLFSPGPGATLANEAFRMMDPVSSRMLGIRSDTTAQIARIASSRLVKELRPLRLMYANDVLRTRGGQKRTERQFCQVGCEIVGREEEEADVEIATVAVTGLAELDVKDITLDLNVPRLVEGIFEEHSVSDAQRAEIKAALADRDEDRLKKLEDGLGEVFVQLLRASGPAEKALEILSGMRFSEEAQADITKLGVVCEGVQKALEDMGMKGVSITIDPAEIRELEYHYGIGFSLFAAGVHGDLGRGGRYNIVSPEGETESATGFTLYMDTVRTAMQPPETGESVFVPAAESWAVIRDLQKEGWIIVRGTGQNKARELCTHEYKDGKVQIIT